MSAARTSALALGSQLLDSQELLGRRVDGVTEASLHPVLRELAGLRNVVLHGYVGVDLGRC